MHNKRYKEKRYKAKRYKVDETNSKENKIMRIAFVIILIVIVAVIVGILSFFALPNSTSNEVKGKSSIEPRTIGAELMTKPMESHSIYFAQASTTAVESVESSTESSTQPTTQVPTQPETQAPTDEPTEEPTEEFIEESEDSNWLIEIDNPDYDYNPQAVFLSDSDREMIAQIVMHEFGDGGYTACCLQAQAFRDAMIYCGGSVDYTYHAFQYDTYSLYKTPNQDCYDAVDYIFAGNMAVPHRMLVMYSPSYSTSGWHESQEFVVEYNGVRYFDMR